MIITNKYIADDGLYYVESIDEYLNDITKREDVIEMLKSKESSLLLRVGSLCLGLAIVLVIVGAFLALSAFADRVANEVATYHIEGMLAYFYLPAIILGGIGIQIKEKRHSEHEKEKEKLCKFIKNSVFSCTVESGVLRDDVLKLKNGIEEGFCSAQEFCLMSGYYRDGIWLSKDKNKAVELLIVAESKGRRSSCFELYKIFKYGHFSGYDQETDKQKAYDWLMKGVNLNEINCVAESRKLKAYT